MFFIDQKGLAKLWREKTEKAKRIEIEMHEVFYKSVIGWEAHIVTDEGKGILVNSRYEVRYWRQLNSALKELKEILPGLEGLTVKTNPDLSNE